MATFAGHYDEVLLKRDSSSVNSLVRVLSGASVEVFEDDGVTVADLWTDRTMTTPAANPVTPDVDGNLEFWAYPGNYVLKISVGGSLVRTDPVTVAPDADELELESARLDALDAALLVGVGVIDGNESDGMVIDGNGA